MKAQRILAFMSGAVCLVLLAWALSPQNLAIADVHPTEARSLSAKPDICIQDWRGIMSANEMHADLAYNPDAGEYLVVFDWDFAGAGDRDVMFITVDPDSGPAPMPWAIADDTGFDDAYPAVAYNPDDGNYLVVWQRRIAPGSYQIFGSILADTAGTPFAIKTGNAEHLAPDVAYSTAAGRFLVVWEDHGAGWDPPPDIQGASLDGSGENLKYVHIAAPGLSYNGFQTQPAVTVSELTGRWLVTWRDTRSAAITGVDILVQQVESTGGIPSLWSGPTSVGALYGDAEVPAVAWAPVGTAGGEYLIVWPEKGAIYARRVQGSGVLVGGVITVSDFASGKYDPGVIFGAGSGTWWTVWSDDRDYG